MKAMEEAGEPLGPRQIAEVCGMKTPNARQLMSRMKKDGLLKSASTFGKYELTEPSVT